MDREAVPGIWADNDRVANVCYEIVIEAVERLPSAEPSSKREWYQKGYRDGQKDAQKNGKWLNGDEMPDYPRVPYKPWMKYCSNCGEMTGQDDNALFNFCPNCGADMRGEQDDNQ